MTLLDEIRNLQNDFRKHLKKVNEANREAAELLALNRLIEIQNEIRKGARYESHD